MSTRYSILGAGLMLCFSLGCSSNGDAGKVPPAGQEPPAGAGDAGTQDAASDRQAPVEKLNVNVNGGYGSGRYAPGETVHVWSAVSTTNGVALPWTGDSTLLKNPNEWTSSFVMPSREVTLTADTVQQELQLTVESYKGSTSVEKTVRYYFPPAMKGLVVMSHGTGGNSRYIENTETFAIALALVRRGFGVLSTEAEESVAGDLNADGKTRWQTAFTPNNTDLKNLSVLISGLEDRGLLKADTPKFALGMSNGGAFSHFLGAIGASNVASTFPKLRFNAVVGYCADATQVFKNNGSNTPSAWYMCGNEDNPEVSLSEARNSERKVAAAGTPTEYLENAATPLYSERFTRIGGVSAQTSASIADELRAAGYVDQNGFLSRDGDEIALEIAQPKNAARFPAILALPESDQNRVRNQLKVLRAEHAQYADQTYRNIAFFEKFL
jgi:poly(3-hydroxybutyrate) depolymerase